MSCFLCSSVRCLRRRQPRHNAAFSKARATRFGLAALIPGLLVPGTSCQSPSPIYFRDLTIDSSLHLNLTGGINLPNFQEPAVGSYYAPFHGAFVTSVDHLEKKPGTIARERSLYLETGKDQVLDRTVKTDEILSGPFGTLDAVKVCFYTRPIRSGFGSVSVEFNGNDTPHELPSEVPGPKEDLPAMTSLSLVRIFGASPEYLIVSANYEQDGSLGSVNFGGAKDGHPGGTGPSGTTMYRTGNPKVDVLMSRLLDPSLTKYGIPARVDVEKYLFSRQIPLPAVALTQEKNVMHVFYGFGKLIRQDELKEGAIVSSRWLQPSVTKEERETLNPLCDARFRQQQAMELPTVE